MESYENSMQIQLLYCFVTILIYLKEFEDFDITDPKAFLLRGIIDARSLKFQESWSVTELSRYLFPICLVSRLFYKPNGKYLKSCLVPACYRACGRFQREEYVSLSNSLIPSKGNMATLRLVFFSWQVLASFVYSARIQWI